MPDGLEIFLARELHLRSHEVGRVWAERLRTGAGAPLSEAAECGASVASWVAAQLGIGGGRIDPTVTQRLGRVVRVRCEQGYTLDALLTELDGLTSLVAAAFREAVRTAPPPLDTGRLLECSERLREGLALVMLSVGAAFQREAAARGPDASRRLERFGQMVAHELKNPLAHIQLGTELLLEQLGASPAEEIGLHLTGIRRAAVRAIELLDDVRMLALAEGSQLESRRLPARVVVESVLMETSSAARAAGVRCLAGPLPEVEVDAAHVRLALLNLIGNAVKYADPAKPERWVRLEVTRLADLLHGCRFSVADNGLGIPRALQAGVFHRHFRAHPAAAPGTGMGLAITRELIEQRHGHLWFHSQEGVGSTFVFVLPDPPDRGDDPPSPLLALR